MPVVYTVTEIHRGFFSYSLCSYNQVITKKAVVARLTDYCQIMGLTSYRNDCNMIVNVSYCCIKFSPLFRVKLVSPDLVDQRAELDRKALRYVTRASHFRFLCSSINCFCRYVHNTVRPGFKTQNDIQ